MYKGHLHLPFALSAAVIAFAPLPHLGRPAAAQIATNQPMLWQGLLRNMAPEEAVAVIQQVDGVKSVRLRENRRQSADPLQIRYTDGKVQIAGMPFDLRPLFEDGALKEVRLSSTEQCGEKATEVFQRLWDALQVKYPEVIVGTEGMRASDVSRANLQSLQSGEQVALAYARANADTAIVLHFSFKMDAPLLYPGSSSNLVRAAWQLAQHQYETRKAECDGTGNRRMAVILRYTTRIDFDAELSSMQKLIESEHQELADKL